MISLSEASPLRIRLISILQLRPFAGVDNLRGINRIFVDLLLQDLSILSDQKIYPARGFVFIQIDSVFVSYIAAPITEQREGDSNLVGEGFVREGTIHAHTQNLGIGGVQPFQILLERLHLLGSTTGEGEDEKGEHDIFLAAVVAQ
jgi:hypothetical protein